MQYQYFGYSCCKHRRYFTGGIIVKSVSRKEIVYHGGYNIFIALFITSEFTIYRFDGALAVDIRFSRSRVCFDEYIC